MAWSQRKIEIELKKKLNEEFKSTPAEADKYYGYYTKALSTLIHEDIYNSIRIIQKGLSDHGENHIMNVLDNAYELLVHRQYDNDIPISEAIESVDAIQLYFICILILFHDVGNLTKDRTKHHEPEVIREVYNHVRKFESEFEDEQILVPEVASKHSGTSSDGSKDTIGELGNIPKHLFGKKILTKKCAALLRFADELAEGPQRTSIFMNKYYHYPYPEKSPIYHKYAEITSINIDRENERICIRYNFKINVKKKGDTIENNSEFLELFQFAIKRMLKLDAERKYCRFYCNWLSPFKRTHVTFNYLSEEITEEGILIRKRLMPKNNYINELFLDDLVLPDDESVSAFLTKHKELDANNVLNQLIQEINEK